MALKTKEQLKDVFSGISSVLFQSTPATFTTNSGATTVTLDPEYDLPVHVDDLSLSEGEPSINHYKVFGVDTDWVATTTKGDFDLNMVIPTLHEDVLKLAYGTDAVSAISTTYGGYNWSGVGAELGTHEVRGTLCLLNQAKDRLLILSNVVLWASLTYDNGSTDPVGIRLSGTIESNEGPDVLYLKKGSEQQGA